MSSTRSPVFLGVCTHDIIRGLMATEPKCPDCERLAKLYTKATMRYAWFGTTAETESHERRLQREMRMALHALNAHQIAQHGELRH